MQETPIIAAVRKYSDFTSALRSPTKNIFLLSSDILSLNKRVNAAHENDKKLYVHLDFCEGLGKDQFGINFIKSLNADGIISTKSNLIKFAKEVGLKTVQRFFIVDSQSVNTALDTIRAVKPDFVEIMPGIMPDIIFKFTSVCSSIIAGGLVQSYKHVTDAIKAGAKSVSTANESLWFTDFS